MRELQELRLYIASPSDVSEERTEIELIIDEFNHTIAKGLGLYLECIKWETHSTPEMGRPQSVINSQLRPEDSDIFIGLLWSRFGTPTAKDSNIRIGQIESGTEEEFELAYCSFIEKKRPTIMFYKCNRDIKISSIDPKQLVKVNKFFERFNSTGINPGLYKKYDELKEFKEFFRRDLSNAIQKLAPDSAKLESPIMSNYHQANGIKHLFLPRDNEKRSFSKIEILQNASYINLIAQTGQAFLGIVGHRYRNLIEDLLRDGKTIKIILSHPTTPNSILRTFIENQTFFNKNKTDICDLTSDVIYELYKESTWFSNKLLNSWKGVELIKRKYKNLVEVRFTKYDIPASILITNTNAFFEPYLNANMLERAEKDILTFDLLIDNNSHLYKHYMDYFNTIWELSRDVELNEINIKHELGKTLNYLKINYNAK